MATSSGAATIPASASASPSVPVAGGTLGVAPTTIVLTPLLGGALTLTASGGPVAWSISEPSSLIGELTTSPSSGTLAAGQSVTVAVTVSGLASIDTQLRVSPSNTSVTVLLGLG